MAAVLCLIAALLAVLALTAPTEARLGARLGWLGALSFASGLPYFFFNETVPVWLAASGMSLAGIGLASGASLPWVLKFLWAPLVDRLGSRRLWIRICLGLLAATTAVARRRRSWPPRRAARGAAPALRHALGHPGHRDRRVHHRDHARPRAGRGQLGADRGVPERELRQQRAAGLDRRAPGMARGVPGGRGAPGRARRRDAAPAIAASGTRRTRRRWTSRSARCSGVRASGRSCSSPCCSSSTSRRWTR